MLWSSSYWRAEMGEGGQCSQRTYGSNERNDFSIQTLKKCTEACNYEITWLYKTKSAHILTKTHNIYIIMQTPQLYHSLHITKSNFMLSFSICLLETDLIRASAQSAHVSFFLTQSSSFPAISPYCEAPHALNLPFKWVRLLSCVLQKNMKLLPPSDPCILTIVM